MKRRGINVFLKTRIVEEGRGKEKGKIQLKTIASRRNAG